MRSRRKILLGVDEQVKGPLDAFAFGQNDGDLADAIPELGGKPGGFDIQKNETGIGEFKHFLAIEKWRCS